MQDGTVVAPELREVRVGVERVHVAGEPVDERLLRQRLVRDRLVGLPVRRHVPRPARTAIAAEAALAAREDAHRVAEEEATLGIDGVGLDDDECRLPLVVDGLHRGRGRELAARRDGAVELDPLLAVEDERRVHVHDAAERHHGGERRDHGEGGQDVQVALVRELELVGSAADAERVEHDVALAVLVGDRIELLSNRTRIHRHAR
jgi:hypothetical protein